MGGFLRGHRRWHWKIAARRRSGRRARAHLAGSTRRLASVARIRRPPSDWQVGWSARDDAARDTARRSRQSSGQRRATARGHTDADRGPGICRSCRSGAPWGVCGWVSDPSRYILLAKHSAVGTRRFSLPRPVTVIASAGTPSFSKRLRTASGRRRERPRL
jgi:hypothetical protein